MPNSSRNVEPNEARRSNSSRQRSKATNSSWQASLLGAFLSLFVIGSLVLFLFMIFFPSAKNALEVRQRTLGLSNAKQIADALNTYRRAHGSYPPPTIVDASGKPLYSWRVLILPYLGYSALYNEYQLDQSWDSATNLDVMSRMPPVFACPGNINALASQETNFALIVGQGTLFPSSGSINPDTMLDNPAETLLVIETRDGAYNWTQPGDISASGGLAVGTRPMIDIGGNYPGCVIAATVDGTPVVLKASVSRASLDALVSPNGQESIDRTILEKVSDSK